MKLQTGRPCLQVGDIRVMDNLSAHHYEGGEILEVWLEEMGIELIYLPTYSPDLNPIEFCFNKLKTLLNGEFQELAHTNTKTWPASMKGHLICLFEFYFETFLQTFGFCDFEHKVITTQSVKVIFSSSRGKSVRDLPRLS